MTQMMKRLVYLLFIGIITFTSCSDQKKSVQNQDVIESEETFIRLDSAFDTYQVVMTGFDSSEFNKYYQERITPPIINLNQPLDNKSISELFLLKNTLFAMKGQVFKDAILVDYFKDIPWYQPPFWDENFEVKLSEEEQVFIGGIDKRMEALRADNLLESNLANTRNAINLFQFENLPSEALDKINTEGFILLEQSSHQPTGHYIENNQKSLPSFITTDLVLHQMHLNYGSLENEIEAIYLTDILKSMLEIINVELYSSYEKTLDSLIEITIEESLLYYSIPYGVITGNKTNLIGNYNQVYYEELGKVLEGKGIGSKVIKSENFDYAIFQPHGHYAKNETIRKYYKALTWLQKISLCLNDDDEFSRAILIAYIIHKSADLRNSYQDYAELKTYFSSQKDQFTFWDLAEVLDQVEGIRQFEDLFKPETTQQIKDLLQLRESESCQIRVSLMPIEYQNLYTDLSQFIKEQDSATPIELFAALGNSAASTMISNPANSASVMENLLKISTQEEAKSMDWLSTLLTSLDHETDAFRLTQQSSWKRKNLNAAMASWIQLNERVNIQFKNNPVNADKKDNLKLIGYVEPNLEFWNAAITLLQNTKVFLSDRHMFSNHASKTTYQLLESIQFLQAVSEKEVLMQPLTDEEYMRLVNLGSEFENLSIELLNTGLNSESYTLSSDMAYSTNIFKGGNNQNYIAGPGYSHVIIVPVEINGYVYLTRGAVYSYYELPQYSNSTISSQVWKQLIESSDNSSPQPWMHQYYFLEPSRNDGIVAKK